MNINVAVTGAKGRMGGQVISGILEHENMDLVACFDPCCVGVEVAPGLKISSPDELENLLKTVKPDVFVDFT
ncbi:MAG: hypothetical protein KAT65_28425, partial [Methanophagales archaeon]|nr:hypothetical protein [Methanophagales archaeon]